MDVTFLMKVDGGERLQEGHKWESSRGKIRLKTVFREVEVGWMEGQGQ